MKPPFFPPFRPPKNARQSPQGGGGARILFFMEDAEPARSSVDCWERIPPSVAFPLPPTHPPLPPPAPPPPLPPPPLRCNLGVYPLARRTGTQTHRSLLFLQAHGCSQYSARTLSNRHRYMQVIRETVKAPGCVTSVFQPGTNLKTRRTA